MSDPYPVRRRPRVTIIADHFAKPGMGATRKRVGLIVSVSGRPGSGKSTVMRKLIDELRKQLDCPVEHFKGRSITTRPARPDDVGGEYLTVDEETFRQMKARGDFLWTESNSGYHFATRRDDVIKAAKSGAVSIMNVTPRVVKKLNNFAGDDLVVSFLVCAPDLARRMLTRGSEDLEKIRRRLEETEDWTAEKYPDLIHIENVDEVDHGRTAAREMARIILGVMR